MRARPVNRVIAQLVLTIGQFEQKLKDEWVRQIEGEGEVRAVISSDALIFSLGPAISTAAQHALHRISGAVMFEMALRYAEKVDGEMWQMATVGDCKPSPQGGAIYLARLPEQRFDFSRICPGFQEVFLTEHLEGDPA